MRRGLSNPEVTKRADIRVTDNGVLLCWYHHRFLDRIGWKLRMNSGVPEVKAPPWHDTDHRWRPVTTSPVRRKKRVKRVLTT